MFSIKLIAHNTSFFLLFALLLFGGASLLPYTATLQAQPAAPNLQCVNILLSGNVQLNWAPGTGGTNCGATFTAYNIYVANNPAGPFTLLTTIPDALQTTFVDATSNPTTTLYYYMETQCGGAVSAPSQTLDTQPPVAPVITTASVLNNNTVQLNWLPSSSPETAGYIIYRADINGNYIPIDTLLNPAATFYQDAAAQPGTQPEAYKIASFDGCTNVTPGPDNGIPHQTVHLTAGTTDCLSEITLNWTKYRGWGTGISGYSLILTDANNVAISTIADLDTATTSFTYPIPDGETNACFRIVARRDNNIDISNSNFVCASIFIPEAPDFICLTNITVGQNDSIFLTWNIDTSVPLNGIRIRRSQTDSTALTNYADYTLPSPISATMNFTDTNTETRRFAYTYQIQHFNVCNQNTYSGIAQTIRLRARDQFNLTNGLDWTPFYLTNATLLNYNIYRSIINDNNYALLATLPPNVLEYEDPLGQDTGVPGYCYRIEAIYQIACPDGFNDMLSSFSNTVCINQAPRIFVPNAFAPNGINNIFKPIILYPNADGYLMQVMNRWGEVLFTTTNPDDGWDGNFKGQLAPQGVYAYYITMKTPIGITLERKGTVMLVR
ncbi:MAG TPA: gliding motility-associated C-terminal domain-containing protein [Chitinophagales bacterium]|nr:gliding motility-associated C-terminal domain-containing protein [Chitinophagales bacterium]